MIQKEKVQYSTPFYSFNHFIGLEMKTKHQELLYQSRRLGRDALANPKTVLGTIVLHALEAKGKYFISMSY